MEEKNIKNLGTTTIGIVCKDGIVLAADKRATAGNLIMDRKTEKIHNISDDMVVTEAGNASDAQLLIKIIKAQIKLDYMRIGKPLTVKETANLLAGMLYNNLRKMSMMPGIAHFILGGKDRYGFHLYDLFPDGTVTKYQDFVSSGSGSVMAYGVLETLYKKDIFVNDGVKLVIKGINAAIKRDNYSGDGIDVVTITKEGVKRVYKKELDYEL
ncbi:MAG: proteasome subunit beta [Nanoarchaeota archaeon]|nr:proteasome subunit beta [Nanoarchaeota archaeon]